MALERKDRIKDQTTTTGTGTVSLSASAPTGFRTFVSAVTSGATVRYLIETSDSSEWEVGEGVFTDASPDTLTRVTVYASSNSGSLVNFSAGTKTVSLILSAQDMNESVPTSGWNPYTTVVPTRSSSASFGNTHDLVFAGVDLSTTLGAGNRIKLTQTAGSNTKSLDLESGSSQYASKTDTASLSITGTITIEARINLESFSSKGTIAAKWYQDGGLKSYCFYITTDGKLNFDYSGDGNLESACASSICMFNSDLGKWVHIAVTLTPSTKAYAFYKNGIAVGSGTASGSQTAIHDNSSSFSIGARDVQGTPDTFFDGKICEVRLWNTARTLAQLQGNMFHNLVGNESGLVGYWKLNNDYNDTTANGNNLTASGSPSFVSDVPAKLTNGTKYGIVNKVTFSTDTTVSVDFGTDYGVDDGTISNLYYSTLRFPLGFPTAESKYTIVVSDNASRTKSSPAQDTFYHTEMGGLFIDIPKANYNTSFFVDLNNEKTTAEVGGDVTLSTSTSAESDNELTVHADAYAIIYGTRERKKLLELTSDTRYYLIAKTRSASATTLGIRGDIVKTIVKAVNSLF